MKNSSSTIVTISFLIVIIAILVFAIIYLSRRTAFIFSIKPTWFYVAYSSLIPLMVLLSSLHVSKSYNHYVTIYVSVALGILLILLLSFFLIDFVNLFLNLNPKVFGIIVVCFTILISTYSLWKAKTPTLKNVEIILPNLNNPLNIIQLSDVHFGHFRGKDNLQRIVDLIKTTDAQFVVITGDLFENLYNCNKETLSPFNQLNIPIYFVNGNHDIYTGDKYIKSLLKEMGINVLENEITMFGDLQIVGLDYMSADSNSFDMMHASARKETISSELERLEIDRYKPSILLHHNPIGMDYAVKAGIGLYLAGHTHGGQLFPLTLINHFAFKYNRGLHRLDNTQIYVSTGSGTFGPPMRIDTNSEVTLIHLIPVVK